MENTNEVTDTPFEIPYVLSFERTTHRNVQFNRTGSTLIIQANGHSNPRNQRYVMTEVTVESPNNIDASGSEELSAESSSGGNITPGLRNPTTPPHLVVSPHQGQQTNIPMPPRPSSNQSENSGQVQMTQPPMTAQGQQTNIPMPPRPSSNQSENSGQVQMTQPPMTAQGGYQPDSMHTYGGQVQNNYPGSSYTGHSPALHHMPSYSQAPSNFSIPSGGSSSSQYSAGGHTFSGFSMNNMMPPPNQYPQSASMSPSTGGAHASAQAAIIAGIRQSPMNPGISGFNGGQDTPMPPTTASTPTSQPMSMNQGSIPSSSVFLGNAPSCDSHVSASIAPARFTQTSAPSSLGMSSPRGTQGIPFFSHVTVSRPSVPDLMQANRVSPGSPWRSLPDDFESVTNHWLRTPARPLDVFQNDIFHAPDISRNQYNGFENPVVQHHFDERIGQQHQQQQHQQQQHQQQQQQRRILLQQGRNQAGPIQGENRGDIHGDVNAVTSQAGGDPSATENRPNEGGEGGRGAGRSTGRGEPTVERRYVYYSNVINAHYH